MKRKMFPSLVIKKEMLLEEISEVIQLLGMESYSMMY